VDPLLLPAILPKYREEDSLAREKVAVFPRLRYFILLTDFWSFSLVSPSDQAFPLRTARVSVIIFLGPWS